MHCRAMRESEASVQRLWRGMGSSLLATILLMAPEDYSKSEISKPEPGDPVNLSYCRFKLRDLIV